VIAARKEGKAGVGVWSLEFGGKSENGGKGKGIMLIHISSTGISQEKIIRIKKFENVYFFLDIHNILWFNVLFTLNRVYCW
jgi:hypothetical protein